MECMNNFLRRKTYRTCAVLISGAAMVMAATVVNENADNNIAKNEAVNRQAISEHRDSGDSDEDVVPGYLSLDRVCLGAVEKGHTDKPQIDAAAIPQVGTPVMEKAKSAEESAKKAEKTTASQDVEKTSEDVESLQTGDNDNNSQTVENVPENAPENEQNLQAENETEVNAQNSENRETAAVFGSVITVTGEEYESLQRIVEAEAGNQDDIGRILVANVVLNRVKSDVYPDTILENIFRHSGEVYQFQPVKNGTYYSVTVSEKTKECVDRALAGEDYSQGALYFTRKTSESSWFNTSLTLLFIHGAHYFYK